MDFVLEINCVEKKFDLDKLMYVNQYGFWDFLFEILKIN